MMSFRMGPLSARGVHWRGPAWGTEVQFIGSGNDRDPILVTVGSATPNNVRVEQLPSQAAPANRDPLDRARKALIAARSQARAALSSGHENNYTFPDRAACHAPSRAGGHLGQHLQR